MSYFTHPHHGSFTIPTTFPRAERHTSVALKGTIGEFHLLADYYLATRPADDVDAFIPLPLDQFLYLTESNPMLAGALMRVATQQGLFEIRKPVSRDAEYRLASPHREAPLEAVGSPVRLAGRLNEYITAGAPDPATLPLSKRQQAWKQKAQRSPGSHLTPKKKVRR